MKTFTVTEPVPSNHIGNTFEVEIRVMHGDADAYDTLVVGPFREDEEEAMSSLIETLERMDAAYPNGRGGDHERFGFQHIEGFESWFSSNEDPEGPEEYAELFSFSNVPYEVFAKHAALRGERYPEWPWDVTGAEIEADFDKYTVYFYDENLVQWTVEVGDA